MLDPKNLTYEKLRGVLESYGEKPFRAQQIMKWIFQKKVSSFSQMTDLPEALREKLERNWGLATLTLIQKQKSQDGTEKFLFELSDKNTIETVYIPSDDRVTLCISTQVGCRMGCKFCLTAKQGLIRHLASSEIVSQMLEVQKQVDQRITNIVMMGMGEPLDNYEAVIDAIKILESPWGLQFSQRKITVSTVGLVPEILRFGKDSDVNLAISLNAPNDDIRNKIMPMNKKYPLKELFEACKSYPLKKNRRITFEYVLLGGINDSLEHARELANTIKGIRCKINLIPFNEHPKGPFKRPSDETVLQFQDTLINQNITVLIRKSRGRDILAACGQLVSQHYTEKYLTLH